MKNNKGITLIALVITIIVMLILVGVTITVAMQGGLFNTARKAATGTEAEKEKELQVASGIYEGKTLEEWAAGEVAAGDNVGETIEQSTEVGGKILYSYDGTKANEKAWTVLHNYGDTIEIVSPEALGELTLGAGYEGNVGDIDEDGVSNTEMDKAIYSCNNAAEIINNYCQSIVTNPNRIASRSFEISDYSEEVSFTPGGFSLPQLPDGLEQPTLTIRGGQFAVNFGSNLSPALSSLPFFFWQPTVPYNSVGLSPEESMEIGPLCNVSIMNSISIYIGNLQVSNLLYNGNAWNKEDVERLGECKWVANSGTYGVCPVVKINTPQL